MIKPPARIAFLFSLGNCAFGGKGKNVFEEDFWQYTQNHFRDHLASAYYQSFWKARRHHFPPDFRKLVDELIEAGPTAPLLEMYS
ncbi:MAG: hypothetical protein WA989_13715 [Henriciella sp.]|uniref:hypothetical protein n=1 Tax=Henriciella sp. TaxID=1968823 RepID=UPI003C721F56